MLFRSKCFPPVLHFFFQTYFSISIHSTTNEHRHHYCLHHVVIYQVSWGCHFCRIAGLLMRKEFKETPSKLLPSSSSKWLPCSSTIDNLRWTKKVVAICWTKLRFWRGNHWIVATEPLKLLCLVHFFTFRRQWPTSRVKKNSAEKLRTSYTHSSAHLASDRKDHVVSMRSSAGLRWVLRRGSYWTALEGAPHSLKPADKTTICRWSRSHRF